MGVRRQLCATKHPCLRQLCATRRPCLCQLCATRRPCLLLSVKYCSNACRCRQFRLVPRWLRCRMQAYGGRDFEQLVLLYKLAFSMSRPASTVLLLISEDASHGIGITVVSPCSSHFLTLFFGCNVFLCRLESYNS